VDALILADQFTIKLYLLQYWYFYNSVSTYYYYYYYLFKTIFVHINYIILFKHDDNLSSVCSLLHTKWVCSLKWVNKQL